MQNTTNLKTNKSLKEIDANISKRVLTPKEIATKQLKEILNLLPRGIRDLVKEAYECKRIPHEYFLSSILFAYSNAAGLAFKIECLNYSNYANLYFAVVGSRGDTKSEAMKIATKPLKEFDDIQFTEYQKEKEELDEAIKKKEAPEGAKVSRKQLLLQNATIEAIHFAHFENPYSIGLYTDELDALIEKMANKKSQDGNLWRIFYLQGFTNSEIDVRRKVADSFRINESYPTLLGSIQHQFLPKLFANGNLESGFIDRLLFVNNLTKNFKLSRKSISNVKYSRYRFMLKNLMDYRYGIEDNGYDISSIKINLEAKAEDKIFEYTQTLLDNKKTQDDTHGAYLSKMMISIHKLTLLVHLIQKSEESDFRDHISLNTVDLAILLNEFYYTNFKMILDCQKHSNNNRQLKDSILRMAISNKASQKSVVEVTGISKGEVSKKYKNLQF